MSKAANKDYREMIEGLHSLGKLLVSKGSAMRPLIPILCLVPILLVFADFFKDALIIYGTPVITVILVFISVIIILAIIYTNITNLLEMIRIDYNQRNIESKQNACN
ncbi:MAG: hypothetical protein OXC62_11245 [Aestuariivita sp.]|nr:hypothetical protein [Aestuariivita sp.]